MVNEIGNSKDNSNSLSLTAVRVFSKSLFKVGDACTFPIRYVIDNPKKKLKKSNSVKVGF